AGLPAVMGRKSARVRAGEAGSDEAGDVAHLRRATARPRGNHIQRGRWMTATVAHDGLRLRPRPVRAMPTQGSGPVGMAVIGAGYWGPNIVRNALALQVTELKWVCDRGVTRARCVVGAQRPIA